MKKLTAGIFYGNIFYGICAVALCIETNLVHHIPLNSFPFYLLIFLCSWIYYTMIYVRSVRAKNYNERTLWYRSNLATIKRFLKVTLALVAVFLIYLTWKNWYAFPSFTSLQWFILCSVPLIAALYTFRLPFIYSKKIRQIGWLKPFVVGLTWAGWVTFYPLLFSQLEISNATQGAAFPSPLFWLQNFLFISILAIIFDVKDYHTDIKFNLNTYPAKLGIANTFRYVIYPVTFLAIVVFFLLQLESRFSIFQTLIQIIPYLLLLWVIATHRKPKHLLYYLVAIDGLMFSKAICGIISILFF